MPPSRTAGSPGLGYWCPVSRSLRHPFGEKRIFGSAGADPAGQGQGPPAPHAAEPLLGRGDARRPGHHRGPTRPAAAHRGHRHGRPCSPCSASVCGRSRSSRPRPPPRRSSANQIRTVPVTPTRGLILDRNGNPLVGNAVTEQITLSRVSAQQDPAVIGRLAALVGKTPAQIQAAIADQQYSLYKPVPILNDAPTADILYIKEHQAEFPGVSAPCRRTAAHLPPGRAAGPGPGRLPGRPGARLRRDDQHRRTQVPGGPGVPGRDAFGQSGLEYQYETALRGTPGQPGVRGRPAGPGGRGAQIDRRHSPGDNIVTNIDTNLQQVADNALAIQIQSLKQTYDPACLDASGNKVGCYPQPTGGAVVVMSPQTGAVYAMSSYPSYNPSSLGGRHLPARLRGAVGPGQQRPAAQPGHRGPVHPGVDVQAEHGDGRPESGLISPNTPYYDTGTFKTPDCQYNSTTCIFHDSAGDGPGTYNVSSAPHRVERRLLLQSRLPVLRRAAQYGPTPIQDQAAQYSLGQLTGIDLPGEVQGRVDSQAVRAKLHAENPKAFPNTDLVHGRQHRDGLRPGRHLHHPDRAGRGLQHLRQRRHPLRPPGGRGRGVADRARSSRSSHPR